MNVTSKLKKITIHYRKKLDGWNFYLMPIERIKIQEEYPNVMFLPNIIITESILEEFEALHSSLQKHIIPTLTGLEPDVLHKLEIEFVNSKTNQSMPFNYD
jgi:hypothetical protein